MAGRRKTGFDKYVEARKKEPEFAAEHTRATAEIRAVDRLVRQLDEARIAGHISKAELARRIGASPEVMRRLFTAKSKNPTMSTLVKLASELGYELALIPTVTRRSDHRTGESPVHP